jgi:hypothetical protein
MKFGASVDREDIAKARAEKIKKNEIIREQ